MDLRTPATIMDTIRRLGTAHRRGGLRESVRRYHGLAASFPVGLAPEDGLPVGFQVMAPPLADDRLYRVGAALERTLVDRWGGPLLSQIKEIAR